MSKHPTGKHAFGKQHSLTRWTDAAGSVAPELASAVRAIREQQGSAAQLDALSARLHAQLAAPTNSDSKAASSLSHTKLIALGVMCIVAVGSLLHFATQAPVATPIAMPPVSTPPSMPNVPPSMPAQPAAPGVGPGVELGVEPGVEPAAGTDAIAEPSAVRKVAHETRPSAPRARASKPVDAEAELVLLGRAQAALDRDANAALALTAEHAREYPSGIFAEEREMLALEAELKLKRDAAAHARAERFMSRYPRSAHARRVRTLLDDSTNNPQTAPTPSP